MDRSHPEYLNESQWRPSWQLKEAEALHGNLKEVEDDSRLYGENDLKPPLFDSPDCSSALRFQPARTRNLRVSSPNTSDVHLKQTVRLIHHPMNADI